MTVYGKMYDISISIAQVKLYTVASGMLSLDDKEVGKVIIHPTPLSSKVNGDNFRWIPKKISTKSFLFDIKTFISFSGTRMV